MTDDCNLVLPSLSVKERIRTMEERRTEDLASAMPSFSVRTTKQIATQQPAPAILSDDDTDSVFSSVTTESASSSIQFTSMTRKAGKLRKERYHRRSQNKKAAVKSLLVDEPSTCIEERDPQQEEPEDTVSSQNADAKRDENKDAPNGSSPDDSILDDAIESLFEVEENAKQIRWLSSTGDEEVKLDEIVISTSNECNDANCISPMSKACSLEDNSVGSFLSFPFPDDEEEMDATTPTVSSNEQSEIMDFAWPLPPTPAARIANLPHPPALVRSTNTPVARSQYEPVTPDVDVDNARTGLPLPSATRAFLSLPTLEESPLEGELEDNVSPDKLKSSDEPRTEDKNEILEQILSENDWLFSEL